MTELFFDTETTGKFFFKEPPEHPGQPDMVQLGAILAHKHHLDRPARILAQLDLIIYPDGFDVPPGVAEIHGITTDVARDFGVDLRVALNVFQNLAARADVLVGHNIDFDLNIIRTACHRADCIGGGPLGSELRRMIDAKPTFCTMTAATPVLNLPGGRNGEPKWPTLEEAYRHFFGQDFPGAHNALNDVKATARVYYHLKAMKQEQAKGDEGK